MAKAVRLLFEYRDGAFVPLPAEAVQMVAPHHPATRGELESSGMFLELRSSDGSTLRSMRVGESGPPTVEFPTGDEREPFGHTEPPPGSVISVVVEDDNRAVRAALVDVGGLERAGERGLQKRDLADVALPGRDGQ